MRDANVEERRRCLKAQMLEAKREYLSRLMSLKISYNTLSFVNRLPAEILSDIFILLADLRTQEYSSWQRERALWLRVTHVCRHWRNIAMDCTPLWSTVLFVTPQLTKAMLERARSTPLSLNFSPNTPNFNNVLSKMLSQFYRLRSVSITGNINDNILAKFSGTAPVLEDLSLVHSSGAFSEPTKLPSDFLRGGAPNLHRLSIEGFEIPVWENLPLVPSVTHLRLRPERSGIRTREWFLEHIQGMPRLQSLELFHVLPSPFDMEPQNQNPTDLVIECATLQTVNLVDLLSSVHLFSIGVRIPNVQCLTLAFIDEEDYDTIDWLRQMLVGFSKSWRAKGRNSARSVSIKAWETYGDDGMTFSFDIDDMDTTQAGPDHLGRQSNHKLCLSFKYNLGHSVGQLFKHIATVLVDLSALRSLRLGPCVCLAVTDWMTFSQLERLDTIVFTRMCTKRFFRLQKHRPTPSSKFPGATDGSPIEPLFPALSTLELRNIKPLESRDILYLIDSMKSRPESQPIKTLLIEGRCGLSKGTYRSIVEALPQVSVSWHRRDVGPSSRTYWYGDDTGDDEDTSSSSEEE